MSTHTSHPWSHSLTPCPSTPACPRPACFLSIVDPSVSTTPPLGRAGHLAGLALSPAPLAPVVPVPGSPALGTSLNGSLLGAWSSGSPAVCRVGFSPHPSFRQNPRGGGATKHNNVHSVETLTAGKGEPAVQPACSCCTARSPCALCSFPCAGRSGRNLQWVGDNELQPGRGGGWALRFSSV